MNNYRDLFVINEVNSKVFISLQPQLNPNLILRIKSTTTNIYK